MPSTARPLRKLGFLTIGLFDAADPGRGHESTLRLIELGERLGFDSAWVRHRHPPVRHLVPGRGAGGGLCSAPAASNWAPR